jgi:HEPN domain-containing protein
MRNAQVWLKEAEWDLKNAQILFKNERYNTVIFLSQQASEKAVKSLLFSEGINGWGHSISNLLKKYKELKNRDIDSIEKKALSLDREYIPTRYPDALPNLAPHEAYDEDDAKKAIVGAEEIIKFVKNELKIIED